MSSPQPLRAANVTMKSSISDQIAGRQPRLQARPPSPDHLLEHRQQDDGEAADGHAVAEKLGPDALEVLRVDPVELEREPDPERDAHHQALAIVQALLQQNPHPEDEDQGHDDDEVRRDDRPRDRDDQVDELRQKRERHEHDADADPDSAGGDSGQLGDADAHAVGGVGNRPREPGQQIAHAVGRDRALDGAKVDRARPAPRDPLNGDGVSERVQRAHQRHHDEGRQESPELRPEAQVDARDRRVAGARSRRRPRPTTCRTCRTPAWR